MRDNAVKIIGLNYDTINEIIIHKGVNEHGRATIRCLTKESSIKNVILAADGISWVSIKIGEEVGEETTDVIFAGVIESISLESCDSLGMVNRITVEVIGGSYLLDIKKEICTYQLEDTEIKKVGKKIKKRFGKSFTNGNLRINNGAGVKDTDKPKCELFVQYMETDYEFLKRCASLLNKPLINLIDKSEGIKINLNIGIPSKCGSGIIDSKIYKEEKNFGEALLAKKLGVKEADDKNYKMIEVRTREYFDLCSEISIDGKTLYVYSVESKYGVMEEEKKVWVDDNDYEAHSSSVFYHIYKLAEKDRFNEPPIYNANIAGISLAAKVTEVEGELLKVKCTCDKKEATKQKEFTYATVYSSNDGTGWYCMPEKDDEVRLHFPTVEEKEAYIVSSVHLQGGNGRDNPDIKFIKNKYNKEVRFEEKSITITNNDGMEIKLDDNKGISIISDKDITLSGKKDVTVLSKKGEMNVSGGKKVLMKQGSKAQIEMKNDVKFKGTNIKM